MSIADMADAELLTFFFQSLIVAGASSPPRSAVFAAVFAARVSGVTAVYILKKKSQFNIAVLFLVFRNIV